MSSGLIHVPAGELSSETAQSEGMRRTAAISQRTTGSTGIWMGLTEVDPGCSSSAHHHGHSETGIFVVAGTPAFSFRRGDEVVTIATAPGDFIFVPPYEPHIESNPGDAPALVVIARTTEESIVENLPRL